MTANAKVCSSSKVIGLAPLEAQELERREGEQVAGHGDQSPTMASPEFPGDCGGMRTQDHASRAGSAEVPTWAMKSSSSEGARSATTALPAGNCTFQLARIAVNHGRPLPVPTVPAQHARDIRRPRPRFRETGP